MLLSMRILDYFGNKLFLTNVAIFSPLGRCQETIQALDRRFFLGLNINNIGSNYAN